MLNDPRSHGLWERTAPPAPPTGRLIGRRDVDVAVIGAGYTGLSAALHLAEGGARVAVLEAVEIGFGGSGRNVGLVNAGLWLMPDAVAGTLEAPFGERLLTLLGDAPAQVFDLIERHDMRCEAERNGTLHCGVGEAGRRELAERAKQWIARGAPVTLLTKEETASRIGTNAYACALHDARAGTIQPLAYARGLGRAAMAAGAEIATRSPVSAVRRDGSGWRLEAGQGSVKADWVVMATDGYTSTGSGLPWQQIREEIVRLPYFNIATKPLSPDLARFVLPGREGCWDTKDVLSSFRLDRAGRLVIGSVGALRGMGLSIHRSWARRSLRRLFPQLGSVQFEAEWYGQIGMTDDALPRFHQLDERVLSVSGYNGRGIAPGTVFGQVLAKRILEQTGDDALPLPLTPIRAQRFRALREAWYETGSQVAHLRARA